MSPDRIFTVANLLALAGWLSLAFFPQRRWPAELVAARVIPALLSGLYAVIVAAVWSQSEGGFSSLSAVAQLFENRWLLLAGWVHYLAFDLFVGSWIVRDARRRGIAHALQLPCLLLTLMFGPAGWLAYLGLRAIAGQRPQVAVEVG